LADHVQVEGAAFENGLLRIELLREISEAMKLRRIVIYGTKAGGDVHEIEAKAA
jgi:molecular chaperone IbpA